MQVVILAGGTNDFHLTTFPPLEEWTSDILNFINTVSLSADEAHVLCCTAYAVHMHVSMLQCDVSSNLHVLCGRFMDY